MHVNCFVVLAFTDGICTKMCLNSVDAGFLAAATHEELQRRIVELQEVVHAYQHQVGGAA